jgi:hypothetical protein
MRKRLAIETRLEFFSQTGLSAGLVGNIVDRSHWRPILKDKLSAVDADGNQIANLPDL